MAYAIRGTVDDSHLLTYRTIKAVKCLYFDGTSAALQYDGSMDSQNVFLANSSANAPSDPVFGDRPPRWPPGGNSTDPNSNETMWRPLHAEYARAAGLCDFIKEKNLGGPGWGYESIVRMNEGFEVIWCNFSSPSAELVSWLNVSAPALVGVTPPKFPRRRPPPQSVLDFMTLEDEALSTSYENWTYVYIPGYDRPFKEAAAKEWFRMAAKTYGFTGGVPGRGEARVKIDSCGLFSFYDPGLVDQAYARVVETREQFNLSSEGNWLGPKNESDSRAAALYQLGLRRRHILDRNISETDGIYMRSAIEHRMRATLQQDGNPCSGIDWTETTRTIVTDYSSPLYDLKAILTNLITSNLTNATTTQTHLNNLRGLSHQFIMPYYEYPPHFNNTTLHRSFSPESPTSLAALDRCKNQHTPSPNTPLSSSETLILTSILSVLNALCTTLLPVFLSTEILWLQHFNNITAYPSTIPSFLQDRISETVTGHLEQVEELMAWLGWMDQWVNCEPGCGVGQVCAIPMWPIPIGVERREEQEGVLSRGGVCVDLEGELGEGK
ncbi:hypothetical protein PRZ48_001931 [Zasmidium cellare]|uniref:Uncharacterized protein n=1 Tax=Zasmidium cellare TaxID=395010 RepID=A0ABR0F568_ZASCE|nr:hypothetical protein PRZ48_001931 [Zasmidium cellare]